MQRVEACGSEIQNKINFTDNDKQVFCDKSARIKNDNPDYNDKRAGTDKQPLMTKMVMIKKQAGKNKHAGKYKPAGYETT
jgi:hypothetical protein